MEGGRLVVMKKVKDSQEDWTTFTHDKSEKLLTHTHNDPGILFSCVMSLEIYWPRLFSQADSGASNLMKILMICFEASKLKFDILCHWKLFVFQVIFHSDLHSVYLALCLSVCLSVSVRQLIKSQRVQNKLGIVFEKEKDKSQRKDFIFASAKVYTTRGTHTHTLTHTWLIEESTLLYSY